MKITLNGIEIEYTSYNYECFLGTLWTPTIKSIGGVKLYCMIDDVTHNFSEDTNGADITATSKKDLYDLIYRLNKDEKLFINKDGGI